MPKNKHEPTTVKVSGRVLIVEDSLERAKYFLRMGVRGRFAGTADRAIALLKTQRFDTIFLDFDLHGEGTGERVAKFLVEQRFAGHVVIHSQNALGAQRMSLLLATTPAKVQVVPIGSMVFQSDDE
ncbi:MAG: response regulator [Candidatus Acidiferrales bacterium]